MSKLLKYLLVGSFTVLVQNTFAAQQNLTPAQNDQQLLLELTGRSGEIKKQPVRATATARQHLNAGFQAFTKKDYILALKHYNTIVMKYPKSAEVRLSYLAKAKLYNEMGLAEQAQRNLKIAKTLETQNLKK